MAGTRSQSDQENMKIKAVVNLLFFVQSARQLYKAVYKINMHV